MQFVDGDCELIAGWCDRAQQILKTTPDAAAVCGRLYERFPRQSIYNQLCDLEWNTPVGEAKACGGIALFRRSALEQNSGFNDTLVAGEEPELCLRLRQQNWRILRIAADMAWHDAEMTRFSQWWHRMVRGGMAYAQGAWMHGQSSEHYCVRESIRIWIWGFLLPTFAIGAAIISHGWSLLLLTLYLLLGIRISLRHRASLSPKQLLLYAGFCILGKFPEFQGQLKFCWLLSQHATARHKITPRHL